MLAGEDDQLFLHLGPWGARCKKSKLVCVSVLGWFREPVNGGPYPPYPPHVVPHSPQHPMGVDVKGGSRGEGRRPAPPWAAQRNAFMVKGPLKGPGCT